MFNANPVTRRDMTLASIQREVAMLRDKCCQRCGGEAQEMSHVYGKGCYPNEYIKYATINVLMLCNSCHHQFWHKDTPEAMEWFEGKFGGRYRELRLLVLEFQNGGTVYPYEIDDIRKGLKKELADIKSTI